MTDEGSCLPILRRVTLIFNEVSRCLLCVHTMQVKFVNSACVDSFIHNSVSPFMETSYPHYGYYRSLGQKLFYTFCFAT